MNQAEKIILDHAEQGTEGAYKTQKCILRKASFNTFDSVSEATRKSKLAASICRREEARQKKKNESRIP